jgi:hypothetical protein
MGIPARQIGWSTESQLLYQIIKQLAYINSLMGGGAPATTTTTTT